VGQHPVKPVFRKERNTGYISPCGDFEVYEKVEMTPEIRKLAEEYLKLKEELQRVKDWLVENRPIE